MTINKLCIAKESVPEDSRSENLQGKNFGNAQLYEALLLFYTYNVTNYLLTLSKISRGDNVK